MTYQHFELICGRPDLEEVELPVESMSMSDALEEVFSADSGLLVMQWNGIFIPLSYKYDVSWILRDVIEMVEQLVSTAQPELIRVTFPSSGFNADWGIVSTGEELVVDAAWREVAGSLVELLRERSPLTFDRRQFVEEWRRLLRVVLRSLIEVGFDEAHVDDYGRLRELASEHGPELHGSPASDG